MTIDLSLSLSLRSLLRVSCIPKQRLRRGLDKAMDVFSINCKRRSVNQHKGPSMKSPLILGKVTKSLYLLHSASSSQLKPRATISSLNNDFHIGYNQSVDAQVSNSSLFLGSISVDVTT
ncbi:hypothetical protein RND71_023384 [Anisodus tanguticus]|uniref:Uncharacterized protein n=1 Tax=Anisodus tanguticus TaxID=243964 RepID=A0AAE1VDQ7_9SOLA|nr:hypothetical protein RND71_023384 [Anisodus tanguticus]